MADDLIERAQSWLDAAAERGMDLDATDTYLTVIRDLAAALRAKDEEIARLTKINSGLCDTQNSYVIHNARLNERAERMAGLLKEARDMISHLDRAYVNKTENVHRYDIPPLLARIDAEAS